MNEKTTNDGSVVNNNEAIIRIEDLKRDFIVGSETVHALRGVTFDIKRGEFVAIMGTSGSGKSTMLNILGCLDKPTSGHYYIDGVDAAICRSIFPSTLHRPSRWVV